MIVIFRILVRFFRHRLHLCAERTEQMHFLRRLIIRNHNNRAISPRPSNHDETDPGVTGCSLHDRCAWLKPTRFLPVSNDSVSGAIFHRAAGIHEFRFSQNLTTRQFRQPPQSNQRRVSNVSINSGVFRSHQSNLGFQPDRSRRLPSLFLREQARCLCYAPDRHMQSLTACVMWSPLDRETYSAPAGRTGLLFVPSEPFGHHLYLATAALRFHEDCERSVSSFALQYCRGRRD